MPTSYALAADEVHVWCAPTTIGAARAGQALDILATGERERAARFHFEKDRESFIASRAALRILLGLYLKRPAAGIHFVSNEYGKPSLKDREGEGDIRFNVAHSHELALLAFARGREVGVDLERVREDLDPKEIARSFFSPRELETLRALPAEQAARAFYNCWTLKEAFVKALGRGLSVPLDSFDVAFGAGEPPALLAFRDGPGAPPDCSLHSFTPAPDYAAALAALPAVRRVTFFAWEWPAAVTG